MSSRRKRAHTSSSSSATAAGADFVLVVGMGGTIDKDYPRTTHGYAFEIDEPAATRVLSGLPFLAVTHTILSVCKKDSTEIDDSDRERLVSAVRRSEALRIVVTHGTDTMIDTAKHLQASGAAAGKAVAFTGAMKPERFKDSDASFNLGSAVGVTSLLSPGSVVVCMGGNVIPAEACTRDTESGHFVRQSAVQAS